MGALKLKNLWRSCARWELKLLSIALGVLHHGVAPAQQLAPVAVVPLIVESKAAPDAESLSDLLGRVLPKDPQVRSTQALAEAAEQRFKQARSRLYGPVLSLESSHGEADVSQAFIPYKQRTDESSATLRWNLFNAGADKSEYNATERDMAAALEDLRRAREESAERIAQTYLEALRYQQQMTSSEQRMKALQDLVEKARLQHDAGKLSDADFVEITTNAVDAELDHDQLRITGLNAVARLRTLVGGELHPLADVAEPVLAVDLQQMAAAIALPSMGSAGLADGPGIVAAARRRAEAAKERVPAGWAAWAPKVDFQYQHQLYDHSRPQITQQQQSGWLITARWDLPLGGEIPARRKESVSRAQAALDEVDRIQLTVDAEKVSLPERLQLSERAMAMLRTQKERYDTLLQAATLQYDAGRRSLIQLSQMVESRYSVQQRLADQQMQRRSAQTRLLALQGDLLTRLGLSKDASSPP